MERSNVVTRVDAWCGKNIITGIRLTFSEGLKDNSIAIIGEERGRYFENINFDYDSGELITSISIWSNSEGTGLGAFRIKTNKDKDFFPKIHPPAVHRL